MKKSFHIFQRDLSRLLHNKAAILVLIGVCLLPSLYAWFNIAANLDPYGNTSKIKVAIACLDKMKHLPKIFLSMQEKKLSKI